MNVIDKGITKFGKESIKLFVYNIANNKEYPISEIGTEEIYLYCIKTKYKRSNLKDCY